MGAGDDHIYVNDDDINNYVMIDGGTGIDTAVLPGINIQFSNKMYLNSDDVIFTKNERGDLLITERSTGDVNVYRNIERFQFEHQIGILNAGILLSDLLAIATPVETPVLLAADADVAAALESLAAAQKYEALSLTVIEAQTAYDAAHAETFAAQNKLASDTDAYNQAVAAAETVSTQVAAHALQTAQEVLAADQATLDSSIATANDLHTVADAAITAAQDAVSNDSLVDLVQSEAHLAVGNATQDLLAAVDTLVQDGAGLNINDVLSPETVDLLANVASPTSEVTVAATNPDVSAPAPAEPDLGAMTEQLAALVQNLNNGGNIGNV
jgi:hypothetical protein